ncbi:MAG TPA: glycosyltransferase [Leptolyngbyaceae cyanobacterium M33_DOE_097]|nr:glycosyltransferase [Leptolyngbyaceae cyanobacterium M33_DOE_097]
MISIITPVYNGEKFIEACIKAVIQQNCLDIEHIIVDGRSKDRTVEIVEHYAKQHSHIRWVSEPDQGQSDALNKGIGLARGEVLSILNVDDYYEPGVLNRIVEIFKALPEPSFVVGNCNLWNQEGRIYKLNKPSKLRLYDLLLGYEVNPHPANPSAYFYHTSLHQMIGLYDVDDHYTMDLEFICRAVQVAHVHYFNETWGNFQLHEESKTLTDSLSGQGKQRREKVVADYRKKLPLIQQLVIRLEGMLYTRLPSSKYFLRYQKELIAKLRSKLKQKWQPAS